MDGLPSIEDDKFDEYISFLEEKIELDLFSDETQKAEFLNLIDVVNDYVSFSNIEAQRIYYRRIPTILSRLLKCSSIISSIAFKVEDENLAYIGLDSLLGLYKDLVEWDSNIFHRVLSYDEDSSPTVLENIFALMRRINDEEYIKYFERTRSFLTDSDRFDEVSLVNWFVRVDHEIGFFSKEKNFNRVVVILDNLLFKYNKKYSISQEVNSDTFRDFIFARYCENLLNNVFLAHSKEPAILKYFNQQTKNLENDNKVILFRKITSILN